MARVKKIKDLLGDTFSYGLSTTLQKLITIFLFPLYARILTPTDFGIQDIVSSTVSIFIMVLVMGLDSAVMQNYYESDTIEKKKIISTYLWFQLLVPVPIVVVVCIFSEKLASFLFNNTSLSLHLILGVISIPFSLAVSAMFNILRLSFSKRKFFLLSIFGILLQISFALLFVVYLRQGVKGVLISILLAYVIQIFLGAYFTYKDLYFKISFEWLKKLLAIGLPILPASISYWLLTYSNRFFLANYADLNEIALLSIVNRISSVLLLVLNAFSSAWGPYAYSIATNIENAKITYSKVLTYFLMVSLFAAMLLSIFSKEIIVILATSIYLEAAPLIFIYSISIISWVAAYIVGMGVGIYKKNYHYATSVILGAIFNIFANYFLIPDYGVLGATYAAVIANLVSLIYMYYAGQFYLHISYEWNKILFIIIITSVGALLGIIVDNSFEYLDITSIFLKICIIGISGFILIRLSGFGVKDIYKRISFFKSQSN